MEKQDSPESEEELLEGDEESSEQKATFLEIFSKYFSWTLFYFFLFGGCLLIRDKPFLAVFGCFIPGVLCFPILWEYFRKTLGLKFSLLPRLAMVLFLLYISGRQLIKEKTESFSQNRTAILQALSEAMTQKDLKRASEILNEFAPVEDPELAKFHGEYQKLREATQK